MQTLWQDFRYGARNLLKHPGFAAVAILTLALGIGANTAIFSVVNGVLLRPLPYTQPERLVWFWDVQKQLAQAPLSSIEFLAYRQQSTSFEQIAAIRSLNFNLTGLGTPERVAGRVVSANYFSMLGVQPALGRNFSEAEDKPGTARVALLTHGFWQTRFGGDPNVIGRTLTVNGGSVAIVGVLPASFQPPPEVAMYLNPTYGVPELFSSGADPRTMPFPHYLSILGRLKPGVTREQAQRELSGIVDRLGVEQVASKGHGISLEPYTQVVIGDVRPTLYALLGVVGLVLLIACANVANLLLVRTAGREREIAVRAAMGATSGRLARQMITEGALLGVLGGAVGLLFGYAGVRAIVAAAPEGLPRIDSIQLDARVLMFTFGIALATGILFGLAPAIRGMRVSPGEALKRAGRSGSGGTRQRWLRNTLVAGEVALSLVLLVGAGLLTHSFVRLLAVKPGFQPENLLTFSISFNGPKYSGKGAAQRTARVVDAVHRIESLPGVQSVAGANDLPLEGQDTTNYPTIEGPSAVSAQDRILVGMHPVTPGYFRAMGTPLLRGREITDADVIGAPDVVVINEALADRVWPGQDPIGKHIHLFNGANHPAEEVIGVVGNIKHRGLNEADSLDGYEPFAQQPWPYMAIAVRTTQNQAELLNEIRSVIADFDPDMPIFSVRTYDQIVTESLGARRVTLALVGLFASLAIVLAAVGIYGVMSYVVAGRTQEIGIRMALGAGRGDVFRLVIGQGMALTGVGLIIGGIAAAGLARFLQSLLFEVKTYDPLTFAGVAILLAGVAALACYIPARRATRVDPLVALRYE
ncbi:MAG TPA: ABC transporter permease [Candidatus Acidoferrales bacterium]|jgi:putative ABC transport system permease protein|nr:ABC transporter permease [Candidatus Acidoferrales bacterium]